MNYGSAELKAKVVPDILAGKKVRLLISESPCAARSHGLLTAPYLCSLVL